VTARRASETLCELGGSMTAQIGIEEALWDRRMCTWIWRRGRGIAGCLTWKPRSGFERRAFVARVSAFTLGCC
jgi:hypothetical protein